VYYGCLNDGYDDGDDDGDVASATGADEKYIEELLSLCRFVVFFRCSVKPRSQRNKMVAA